MTDKLQKAGETGVALPYDYSEFKGQGPNITMDDLKVPFISLIQEDSKVRFEDEEKYVPGSEAGDMLNSATKELIKQGETLLLVPAVLRTTMIEYLPDRGGYVGEHEMNSQVAIRGIANGNTNPENGNDLVKTKTLFAIRVDADLNPIGFVVVGFSASKLGPWSDYWTKIDTCKATKDLPEFLHLVSLSTKDVKNTKGQRYKNYQMIPARNEAGELTLDPREASILHSMIDPNGAACVAAQEFRKQVLAGKRVADREQDEVTNF